MCDCKQNTERRLVEALSEPGQLPKGAERVEARLTGYAVMVEGNTMRYRQVMEIDVQYRVPVKTGGLKTKKQKLSMAANYCMFCGEKYNKDTDQ